MKRLPLIIGLVLGLSAIGFAIYGATILWGVVAAFRDWGAEDTSNLPQAPLSEVLSEDLTTVDFLVFHDGPRGWYLVDDPAPFGDTEIGFYGRRFLGHLTNTGPSPNYCSVGGMIGEKKKERGSRQPRKRGGGYISDI